eukprot:Awhi_evm1s14452
MPNNVRARKTRRAKVAKPKKSRKTYGTATEKLNLMNSVMEKAWDKKKTMRANYDTLGLQTNLNEIRVIGPTETVLESDDEEDEFKNNVNSKHRVPNKYLREVNHIHDDIERTSTIKELEHLATLELKLKTTQSDGERKFLEDLIEKYGDDFTAMSRDRKLNPYQHTKKQLKSKILKYLDDEEQLLAN